MATDHSDFPGSTTAELRALIATPDLDARVRDDPAFLAALRRDLARQSERAWAPLESDEAVVESARSCVQRSLYELNRIKLYWFDDPEQYVNERSLVLAELHAALEAPWQAWLLRQAPGGARATSDVAQTIRTRAARDATPCDTPDRR